MSRSNDIMSASMFRETIQLKIFRVIAVEGRGLAVNTSLGRFFLHLWHVDVLNEYEYQIHELKWRNQ